MTSSNFDQFGSLEALRWYTSAGIFAFLEIDINSSSASNKLVPSLRRWEIYIPPYSDATLLNSVSSSVEA